MLSALLKAAGLKRAVGGDAVVRSLSHDSRTVARGALFAALPSAGGKNTDTRRYARQSVARGAAALLAPAAWKLGVPVAVAGNTRAAYGRLASAFHGQPTSHLELVGITGTNGKTTTAHLLYGMLEAAGRKPAMLGTIAHRVGGRQYRAANTTPWAPEIQSLLARALKGGARAAVMEVSSHALDQDRDSGCRFAVGAFTNLTQDHLDYHKTMAAYRRAKAKLFRRLAQSGGQGVWNLDDPAWKAMRAALGRKGWGYSLRLKGADVTAEGITPGQGFSRFTLATPRGRARVRFPMAGRFNIANALAAAASALALGLDLRRVAAALETPLLPPGRLQRVDGDGAFAVLVDYAHTPDALARAVAAAREGTPGRVITVFGAGGDRDRSKRPLMAQAAQQGSDLVIVTSDNPRTEDPERILNDVFEGVAVRPGEVQKVLRMPDRAQAIARAVKIARPGDCVLIAGKGHEDYQIVGTRRFPFSDVKVARKALRARG